MSQIVDKRIVRLEYDGENFDKKIERSEKAFESFKETVESDGNRIVEALENLTNKMSAKTVIISSLLHQLTMDATRHFRKFESMWIQAPVTGGWDEYQAKMQSIFNVFSAVKEKGYGMVDVKREIEVMNRYADRTVYNFRQMTSNYQRFVTAGKGLEQARHMVLGLSNLAASVGASNERLVAATYQISNLGKELTSYEYRSMVRAGLASENFRNTMIDVARESDRTMKRFGGKEQKNSAAEYFDKAEKSAMSFRNMVMDLVFTDTDFEEAMRRFSIEVGDKSSQKSIDDLVDKYKDLSKTTPIPKDLIDNLKKARIDTDSFNQEIIRVVQTGEKYISTFKGVSTETMTIQQYLKKATDEGISFNDIAKDMNISMGDVQKTLDRFSLARNMFDAATQIRTLSHLIRTVKEDIESDWAHAIELIVGDLDHATALWTGLALAIKTVVNDIQGSINDTLEVWNELGGREHVIRGFANILNAIADYIRVIFRSLKAVFGVIDGKGLVSASKKFEQLTLAMRPSIKTVERVGKAFYIFFGIIRLGWRLLKNFILFLSALFEPFKALRPLFKNLGASIAKFFTGLGMTNSQGKPLVGFFEVVISLTQRLIEWLTLLSGKIIDFVTRGFDKMSDKVQDLVNRTKFTTSHLKDISEVAKDTGKSIGEVAESFIKSKGWDSTPDLINKVTEAVKDLENTSLSAGWSLTSWFTEFKKTLPSTFDELMDFLKTLLEFKLVAVAGLIGASLAKALNALFDPLRAIKFEYMAYALTSLTIALWSLQKLLKALSDMEPDQAIKALILLSITLSIVVKFMKKIVDVTKGGHYIELEETRKILKQIRWIFISIALSLRVLQSADPVKLITAVIALKKILQEITVVYQKVSGIKNPKKSSDAFRELVNSLSGFAICLRVLASANILKLFVAVGQFIKLINFTYELYKKVKNLKMTDRMLENIDKFRIFTGGLSLMMIGLRILADAKLVNIIVSTRALTKLFGVLGEVYSVMAGSEGKFDKDVFKSWASMITGLGAVTTGLHQLADKNAVKVWVSGKVLVNVIKTVLKVFIKLTQEVKRSTKKVTGLIEFLGGVAAIVTAMSLLAAHPLPQIIISALAAKKIIKISIKLFETLSKHARKLSNLKKEAALLLGGIASIILAIALLAKVGSVSKILASAIAIRGIIKTIGDMFSLLTRKMKVDYKQILAFTGGITLITLGLAVLSLRKTGRQLSAGIALALVVRAVGNAISYVLNFKNITEKQIIAFTGGVSLIALGLTVLSLNTIGRQLSAGLGLAAVVAAIGFAMAQIIDFKDITESKILAFTGGIALIALGLSFLANSHPEGILAASIGLSAVVIALGLAMSTISENRVPFEEILAFSAGISIIALSLSVLSNASPNLKNILGMILVMGSMAGIIALLSKLSGEMLMASSSMLIFSVGLLAMAHGMAIMAELPIVELWSAVGVIFAMVGALTLLTIITAASGGLIIAAAGAMTLFGTGVAALGYGLNQTVKALETFIYILAESPKTIERAAKNLKNMRKELSDIAVGIGQVIGDLLLVLVKVLIVALVTLLEELSKHVATIASLGTKIIVAFIQGLLEHVDDLVEVGVLLLAQVIYGIAAALPTLIDAGFILIMSFLMGLEEALHEHMGDITDIATNFVITFITGILEAIKKTLSTIVSAGRAIKSAFLAAVTGGKWSNVFDSLLGDLRGLRKEIKITGGSIEYLKENLTIDKSDGSKFSNALSGAKSAVSDFKELLSGDKGFGFLEMLGYDKDFAEDFIDPDSLFPTGDLGEASGEFAEEAVEGYEEGLDDKKTKKATERYVNENMIFPLINMQKKIKRLGETLGKDLAESVTKSLTAEVRSAKARAALGRLSPLVEDTIKTMYKDEIQTAEREAKLEFARREDEKIQKQIEAYESLRNEEWNKQREKELEKVKKHGGKIPEAYMTEEEKWKEAVKNMTEAQYEALKTQQLVTKEMETEFDFQAFDKSAERLAEQQKTLIGSMMHTVVEMNVENEKVLAMATKTDEAIFDMVKKIEESNISTTLNTLSFGLGVIGGLAPEINDVASALANFSKSLSQIGEKDVDNIVLMYEALSELFEAVTEIAISKLRRIMDMMIEVAEIASSGLVELITTPVQLGVDIVLNIVGWVLGQGDELPDPGKIMGSLVKSLGETAVSAGTDIANSLIGGMMDVFGLGAFKGIVSAFTGMFGILGKMTTDFIGQLIPMVYTAAKNLTQKLMPLWSKNYFNSFERVFKNFFNRLFGSTPTNDATKWFREHGAQAGEVYIEGIAVIDKGNEDALSTTSTWLHKVAKKLKESGSLFGQLAGDLLYEFVKAWDGFTEWFYKIGNSITQMIAAGAAGKPEEIYDFIMDFLYNLTGGFLGKSANLSNLGNNIVGWILNDDGEISERIQLFTKTIFDILTLGVNTRGEDAILLGKMMNDRILEGLADTPEEALTQIISGIITSVMQLLIALLPKLIILSGEIKRAVFDGFMDFIKQGSLFKLTGAVLKGLIDGFFRGEYNVFTLGKEMATAMWDGFKSFLGIKTTTKMVEQGSEMMAGLAEGFSSDVEVDRAMQDLADDLNHRLNDIIDDQPVIRPILDLSDLNEKIKNLDGMFTGVRVSSDFVGGIVEKTEQGKYERRDPRDRVQNVTYEQNIYAPTQLSPREIYRETDNLLKIKKGRFEAV